MITAFFTGMIIGWVAGMMSWLVAQSLSQETEDAREVERDERRVSALRWPTVDRGRKLSRAKLTIVSARTSA